MKELRIVDVKEVAAKKVILTFDEYVKFKEELRKTLTQVHPLNTLDLDDFLNDLVDKLIVEKKVTLTK